MWSLLRRNSLLYFRNRSGVFASLLGALISFILYLIFLQKNLQSSWSQVVDGNLLLDSWLMGGTLAITGLTTSLAAYSQLVKDKENKVDQDLFLTDLGVWRLHISYLLSSSFVAFIMQILVFLVMKIYFRFVDQLPIQWERLPEVICIMLLSSILASLLNGILVLKVNSVDSLGRIASIVGAASGFLVGTYVPIGILPQGAQVLMKLTPATYVASLYRQVLMEQDLIATFSNNASIQKEFEEKMGIYLKWDGLLTSQQTWLIVIVLLVVSGLVWLLVQVLAHRKLGLQVKGR